jgi:hypothetical protein
LLGLQIGICFAVEDGRRKSKFFFGKLRLHKGGTELSSLLLLREGGTNWPRKIRVIEVDWIGIGGEADEDVGDAKRLDGAGDNVVRSRSLGSVVEDDGDIAMVHDPASSNGYSDASEQSRPKCNSGPPKPHGGRQLSWGKSLTRHLGFLMVSREKEGAGLRQQTSRNKLHTQGTQVQTRRWWSSPTPTINHYRA